MTVLQVFAAWMLGVLIVGVAGYVLLFRRYIFGPTPVLGETWRYRERDPWARSCLVKIREVGRGWVRYDMGAWFEDQRMEAKHFCDIYEKVEAQDELEAAHAPRN